MQTLITKNKNTTQVQADWNQTNTSAVDYIKNKPTIPSAQVQTDWNQNNSEAVDYIKNRICYKSLELLTDDVLTMQSDGTISGSDSGGFVYFNTNGLFKIGNICVFKINGEVLSSFAISGASDNDCGGGGGGIFGGIGCGYNVDGVTGAPNGENTQINAHLSPSAFTEGDILTVEMEIYHGINEKFVPQLGGVQFKIEGYPAALKASLDGGTTCKTVTLS